MENLRMCPKFEAAFELLGKRWTGLIIYSLQDGPKRYKEISQIISNMSDRMLSERIAELEKAWIVKRNVYPEKPVRIEYELTEKGKALSTVMDEVQKWANNWIE